MTECKQSLYYLTSEHVLWGDDFLDQRDICAPSTSDDHRVKENSCLQEYHNAGQVAHVSKGPALQGRIYSWVNPSTMCYACMWEGCNTHNVGDKEQLRWHIEEHLAYFTGTETEFSCPITGCTFASTVESVLRGHISMHLHHAQLQMDAMKKIVQDGEFREIRSCGFSPILQVEFEGLDLNCCWEYCTAVFDDVTEFFSHITQHVDVSWKGDKFANLFHCGWQGCNKEFANRGDLRKHVNRHIALKKCACPFCGAWLSSWEKLGLHLRRKTDCTSHQCLHCLKFFADSEMLARHVPTHISKEQCNLCGIRLRTKYELERHMQTIHCEQKQKEWKCDVAECGKSFQSSMQLVQHRQGHAIPQFKCKHCKCIFIFRVDLNRHKTAEHPFVSKSRLYECHICLKRVDSGSKLSYHLRRTHDCLVPAGFSRFTFKLFSDNIYRVVTVKLTRDMLED